MKIKNIVITFLLIISTLFVQLNTLTNEAYSVNFNEPFGVLAGKETSIHDGDQNLPASTRAIISFNRNVSTQDVFDHNLGLIKVYDESGNELPYRAVAHGDNGIEIGLDGGLQPAKRYHIKIGKGLAAEGGTEFLNDDHNIVFTTEGSEAAPAPAEEQPSELDKLKEEVERAKRESEENARLQQEVEAERKRSEEAAREAERQAKEKKEVEIPEEQNIDESQIDEAIGTQDQGLEEENSLADPKTFVIAVIILALIVIILTALITKLNRDKQAAEDKALLEREKAEVEREKAEVEREKAEILDNKEPDAEDTGDSSDNTDVSGDVDSETDVNSADEAKEINDSKDIDDISDMEKTGRFEGIDKK